MTIKECQHIVLDAGHISVESDLADKTSVNLVKAKAKQEYGDEDYVRLESLMYDKYYIKLEDAQVRPPASLSPLTRFAAAHGSLASSLSRCARRRTRRTFSRRRTSYSRAHVLDFFGPKLYPRSGSQSHAIQGLGVATGSSDECTLAPCSREG